MKRSLHFIIIAILLPFYGFATAQTDSTSLEYFIQNTDLEVQEGANGLYYAIEKEGKGVRPKARDYVKIRYTGRLLNGQVFDQSKDDQPFVFQLGYRIVIQGWEEGIPLFPVGSSGKLFVPAELAYGDKGLGEVPPNTDLVFDIEILDILSPEAYDQHMMEQERRERKAYQEHIKNQFNKDKKLIQEYAIDNKLRTKRTPSGLTYSITKKGKGETAKSGDELLVHYEGFLLNGDRFDSSYDKKEPYRFVLGRGKVIKGWDEGLHYFKKGGEGWILIPSRFAYGRMAIDEEGISIPADAVLVFKIKVIDIKSVER